MTGRTSPHLKRKTGSMSKELLGSTNGRKKRKEGVLDV